MDRVGLGGCVRAKVNIMSRQNARFMQHVSMLWAHKFQSVTSVRTECGATSRNMRSVRTRRWLGCLRSVINRVGSSTKEAFVLRTEAACASLAARDARSQAAWVAWQARTFGGGLGGLESIFRGGLTLVALQVAKLVGW